MMDSNTNKTTIDKQQVKATTVNISSSYKLMITFYLFT